VRLLQRDAAEQSQALANQAQRRARGAQRRDHGAAAVSHRGRYRGQARLQLVDDRPVAALADRLQLAPQRLVIGDRLGGQLRQLSVGELGGPVGEEHLARGGAVQAELAPESVGGAEQMTPVDLGDCLGARGQRDDQGRGLA